MAYAIIKTGGRQYRVAEGDTIDVDLLEGDAGQKMTFGDVLMHADGEKITHGSPSVSGATQGQEGHRVQVPPPQRLSPHGRPSPEVDSGQDHRNQAGVEIEKNYRERGAGRRVSLSTFNFSNGS